MSTAGVAPADKAAGRLQLGRLQRKLGYQFQDQGLLLQALTHRSASTRSNNERLEYLGDAVLSYVVARHLYRARPAAPESALTLARSALVKRTTLAETAQSLSLGDHLAFGVGEMRSGAHRRASILADALEAVIGAVHEDGGADAAAALVERLLEPRLGGSLAADKDAKSALQECIQARSISLPDYRILEERGPRHAPCFVISCEVAELGLKTTGQGDSRKEAEKRAAAKMLGQIGVGDEPS